MSGIGKIDLGYFPNCSNHNFNLKCKSQKHYIQDSCLRRGTFGSDMLDTLSNRLIHLKRLNDVKPRIFDARGEVNQ